MGLSYWLTVYDATEGTSGDDTFGEYIALHKEQARLVAPKGRGIAYNPTIMSDSHRRNASTMAVTMLNLDCDGNGHVRRLRKLLDRLGFAHVYHQSGGWRPGVDKWRICLLLSEPFVTDTDEKRAEWTTLYHQLRTVFGALAGLTGEGFDAATAAVSTPWYFGNPRTHDAPARVVIARHGATLDLRALIARLPEPPVDNKRRAYKAKGPHPVVITHATPSLLELMFEEAGLLGEERDESRRCVRCPQNDLHTDSLQPEAAPTNSTILWRANGPANIGHFYCLHNHCRGLDTFKAIRDVMERDHPDAVERALKRWLPATKAEIARAELDAEDGSGCIAAPAAQKVIYDAISNAPSGMSAVRVTLGAGKTQAAIRVAKDRAALGLKTVIVAPTHKLLRQIATPLATHNVKYAYLRSPSAHLDSTEQPVCVYGPNAKLIQAGGYFTRSEFCVGTGATPASPCPHAPTCPAAHGFRRNGAFVTIAPYQYLSQILDWLGDDGLLIIDESPAAYESMQLGTDELQYALKAVRAGENSSPFVDADVIRQLLRAVLLGLDDATDVFEALRSGIAAMIAKPNFTDDLNATLTSVLGSCDAPYDQLMEIARLFSKEQHCVWKPGKKAKFMADMANGGSLLHWLGAFKSRCRRLSKPRVLNNRLVALRTHSAARRDEAEQLGRAARTIQLIMDLLTTDVRHRIMEGRLFATVPAAHIIAALVRIGPTVVLDATFDAAILGLSGTPVTDIKISDGAPIERTMVAASITRRRCCPSGRIRWRSGLLGALRAALDRALADPACRDVGIITYKVVADELRRCLTDPTLKSAAAKQLARLRARGITVRIGHYGALRGLDEFKDCDALITIGDPWPSKPGFQHLAEQLGTVDNWHPAYRRQCRAELAQAHGRLRTPWRTKPGHAIHVGSVPPLGWPASTVLVRPIPGRPKTGSACKGSAVRAWRAACGLNQRAAAKELGVSQSALSRYESGSRPVPEEIAAVVLSSDSAGPQAAPLSSFRGIAVVDGGVG